MLLLRQLMWPYYFMIIRWKYVGTCQRLKSIQTAATRRLTSSLQLAPLTSYWTYRITQSQAVVLQGEGSTELGRLEVSSVMQSWQSATVLPAGAAWLSHIRTHFHYTKNRFCFRALIHWHMQSAYNVRIFVPKQVNSTHRVLILTGTGFSVNMCAMDIAVCRNCRQCISVCQNKTFCIIYLMLDILIFQITPLCSGGSRYPSPKALWFTTMSPSITMQSRTHSRLCILRNKCLSYTIILLSAVKIVDVIIVSPERQQQRSQRLCKCFPRRQHGCGAGV